MSALALHGVSVRYGRDAWVLRDVDVEVEAGRRLALIGANGAGKTTLLRTLSGSLRPTAGEVLVDETPLNFKRTALTAHRRAVQLVLQDPDDQLFSADVHAEISYGPTNLGLDPDAVRARVAETAELLGITELLTRPVHHLSYGQRKRVALAGAVAMQPRFLLLDEPTAGLDPAGCAALLACLERLEGAGTTVVLSTHDMALVWEWADTVTLLDAGRAVSDDAGALLGDADLLRHAQLDRPWQADLLDAAGLPVSAADRPRSRADVLAAALHR